MNDLQALFLKDNPCKILNKLYELQKGNGGVFTQQDLADETGMPKSNVSRICFKMEDQFNLIESQRDGREKLLGLTAQGFEVGRKLDELLEVAEK